MTHILQNADASTSTLIPDGNTRVNSYATNSHIMKVSSRFNAYCLTLSYNTDFITEQFYSSGICIGCQNIFCASCENNIIMIFDSCMWKSERIPNNSPNGSSFKLQGD